MANKESIAWQTALSNKIKEWEKTEDFAAGRTNKQKLNRTLNLLLGSDPDVVIDMLGGDFVPDDPRQAMNLIRSLDLKTLKAMEILPLTGKGNKLVGHHGIAAVTLQNLRNMPPAERLKVYKGLSSMGQRYGMDPQQIFLIADKIHESLAHGGDFKGKKTGVNLPYIVGETGDEFLRRFEGPIERQLSDLKKAVDSGETQSYYRAINALEDNLQLPRNTLTNPDTPINLKGAATKLFEPIANPVRDIVNRGGDIEGGVGQVIQSTSLNPKALSLFEEMRRLTRTPIVKNTVKGLGGFGALASFGLDAKAVSDTISKPRTNDMEQTSRDFGGLAGAAGILSLFNPWAGGTAAAVFSGAQTLVDDRIRRDKEKQRTQEIMNPDYKVTPVYGELQDTKQLEKQRGYDIEATL